MLYSLRIVVEISLIGFSRVLLGLGIIWFKTKKSTNLIFFKSKILNQNKSNQNYKNQTKLNLF